MGLSQRKLTKAKVLSERIGVEESFFCYVTIKLTNKYIDLLFCKGACPHVRHGMQALQEKN